ncbi:hypothetical protein NPIL_422431 [Nephila pilipes]|uniref:Uncharacterized protein n=1 Tax=Nephila pilipes TaxID=299642 RepID=A0A8X6Q9V6_NEPPI|nr:hypothetical protein NPIL_422431 [Nephila pilipes]
MPVRQAAMQAMARQRYSQLCACSGAAGGEAAAVLVQARQRACALRTFAAARQYFMGGVCGGRKSSGSRCLQRRALKGGKGGMCWGKGRRKCAFQRAVASRKGGAGA